MNLRALMQRIQLRFVITGLFAAGIVMVAIPLIAGLVIVSFYALLNASSTYAKNTKRQTQVKVILIAARDFYKTHKRYPNTIEELVTTNGPLPTEFTDGKTTYPFGYQVTDGGKNCVVSGLYTNGKLFSEFCLE